jgi:acetolactate synthase-1/2/3 large subunit
VGAAAATLRELLPRVSARPAGGGAARAAMVRGEVRREAEARARSLEMDLLGTIRSTLPRDGIVAWDMTILGYLASIHYVALAPRTFLYPLGSGTLGFAWLAALGAKAARPETPVMAVVGDGGFMYGLSELASARQHGIAAKLLLIDDGGYGILREYQRESFDAFHGVDLKEPDFEALINAFGIPVRVTSGERFKADLEWAFGVDGPAALILRERLVYATKTE